MGIENTLRKIDGTDSHWDSVQEVAKLKTFNSDTDKKIPRKRSPFKWPFGRRGEKKTKGTAEQGDLTPKKESAPEATVDNPDVTEDEDFESEVILNKENYGFDEGHQEGELDYQTSTLEYQILHYALRPKDKKDLMEQLPDDNRERVDFVDKYINLFQECPSSGRSFSQAEAFALFRDYKEHISDLSPDQVPSSKVGVLLELEAMLEEKMEAAKAAGDEEAYKSCEKAFLMISDLETSEAIEDYYDIAKTNQDRGSAIAMRSYIKNLIDREGYCGTAKMRNHKPPIEGGALRLERNLKILELLQPRTMSPGETTEDGRTSTEENPILADYPIADLASEIDRTDFSTEDWHFIEQFSYRGKELHDYIRAFYEAKKDLKNRDDYRKRASEYSKSIQWLRSDTPTEKLPAQIQEMLKREKLTNREIAGRFYEAETSTRKRIEMLRGDGELPEVIQRALDASGQSRPEYANTLEVKANELHQKAMDAYNGNITDEQREKANKIPIRREELAHRQERSRDALLESAVVADNQYRAVKTMVKRTPEDFARQVLLSEVENMPQVPKDAQAYLFRNYGKSMTALKVLSGNPSSKSFYTDRLIQLRKTVRADAVYYGKIARSQESKYGTSIAFDYETGTSEENPSSAMRKEESLINEKILPALDRIIARIGGEVPYDDEEKEAKKSAKQESDKDDEVTSDGERVAA